MRISQVAAAVLALVLLVHAAPAQAQTFRGTIRGMVFDASGGVLPGVSITIKNSRTGLERSAVTDEDGIYIAPELPIGDYSVTGSLTGFKSHTVEHVTVEVAIAQQINLQLAVGNLSDLVTVTASEPLVQRTGNTLGGTITATDIAAMPINGRDFTKLLVLVPGAAGDPSAAGDSPGSFGLFSVNGSRGRSNNYLLDGTDMNDGYRNLPAINQGGVFGTPATILPVDAIAEVADPLQRRGRVRPQRGRDRQHRDASRAATSCHGSAFEYFRDDTLDSRNFFNPEPAPKNEFRNHQFGGSLGGPIVKDKTFFFVRLRGPARARRPAERRARARRRPSSTVARRRDQSRDRACSRATPGRRRTGRRPTPTRRTSSRRTDASQPRRQPDRARSTTARRQRRPDRALLLRRQRSELPAGAARRRRAARLQHGHADQRADPVGLARTRRLATAARRAARRLQPVRAGLLPRGRRLRPRRRSGSTPSTDPQRLRPAR